MKERKFVPVMLTPFDKEGKVDYACLEQLTEYYLQNGAGGLFVNCLSSEMYQLDSAERVKITQLVVRVASGSVPVVSTGTFGGSVDSQADFVQQIAATDVDATIVITSQLAGADEPDERLEERFNALLEKTGEAKLGFYECPMPYKRVLPAPLLGRLAKSGRISYYKDTSLDEASVRAKLKATEGLGLGIYDAYMVNAVSSLKAGCAGLSCIQGNYFPELVSWLCQHFEDPACTEAVEKVQQFFTDHMDIMHVVYPASAKYILQKRGFNMGTTSRKAISSINVSQTAALNQLLERFNQLAGDIGL